MRAGNRQLLLTELVMLPNLSQFNAVKNAEGVRDDNVIICQSGKYTLMASPSHYKAKLAVLLDGKYAMHLTPILVDDPKVIVVSTQGDEGWDESSLPEYLTEGLLDTVFRNIENKTNLGTYHNLKGSKGSLFWNFHNYQVYYKGA